MSNITLIVQKLVSTGWNFSIDTKNISLLIVKLIVLSLKYIDKQRLWNELFKDSENHHVDWSMIKPDFNAFNDLYFWIPMIEQCHWGTLQEKIAKHPIITHMQQSLCDAGIETNDKDHDLACQLLILHLLHGIPVLYAFELLTCRKFNKNTHHMSAVLLANISNILYKPEEYECILQDILHVNHIHIDTTEFQEKLDLLNTQQESIKTIHKQSITHNNTGRPRLRDLLDFSSEDKLQMDMRLGTWESFVSYCQLHQFPNILNEVTKQRFIFLPPRQDGIGVIIVMLW